MSPAVPGPRVSVVLLPGIRGDAAELAPLAAALARLAAPGALDVHALDLPRLHNPAATLADHAAALLPRLPRVPFVAVGASFGGLLAWAWPAGTLAGLLTIGTLPAPSPAQARCRWSAPLVRRLPGPVYRRLYGARARSDWLADDPDPQSYARLRLPCRGTLASRLAAIGRWGLPSRPPAPAWWAWGRDDRHVSWSTEDARAIGATPLLLPGGHRPHLSHPEVVARVVLAIRGRETA